MSSLRPYQKAVMTRAMRQNVLIAHGCGTGKTREAIFIILTHAKPALILCTQSTIERVWVKQINEIAPPLKPVVLWGKTKAKREKLLKEDHQCYIITHESAKAHFRTIQDKGFKTLIVDESSKMKNYKSKITAFLLALAGVPVRGGAFRPNPKKVIPHRFPMSGTPAPNSRLEWWPQSKFASGWGKGFEDNFYRFRDRYFSGFNVTPKFKVWSFRSTMLEEFNSELAEWTDVVRTEDVLPDLQSFSQVREVKLKAFESKAYREMEEDCVTKVNNGAIAPANALTQFGYLRQLASGFLYNENGSVVEFGRSKLDAMVELLEEIGDNRVILWYHFEHEKDQLLSLPGTRHIGKPKERAANLKDFEDGKFTRLVASPAMLGHGVNLQFCHYVIYYSLSPSYEQFDQSRRRVLRDGQGHTCFYYYMVAKGTYDEALLKILENKGKVVVETFEYLKGLGK